MIVNVIRFPTWQNLCETTAIGKTAYWSEDFLELYKKDPKDAEKFLLKIIDLEHECYSDDTEILTKEGWKYFNELSDDEIVFTLNPETHKIELETIKRNIEYIYDGKMFVVDNEQIQLKITPNHRVYVCKDKYSEYSNDYKFVYPKDLVERKWYFKRDGDWFGEEEDCFVLGDIQVDMQLFLAFLGIYLAEGCISERIGKKSRSLKIRIAQETTSQHYVYMKDIIENVCGLLDKILYTSDNKFTFTHDEFGEYLKQFGKSREKYVPDFIKNLSIDLIEIFLNAYAMGDGCFYEDGRLREICTASKQMADDLQELFLKIGKSANVKHRIVNDKSIYHVTVIYYKNQPAFRHDMYSKCFREEEYRGNVYCVETENGIIYVRRNGVPVWCGNSVLEHLIFTFNIQQASRWATHEHVRHRIGSFTQKSLRRVREMTPGDFVVNPNLPEEEIREAREFFDVALQKYYGAIERGLSPDDARIYIPGSVMSEITWTVNLRALRNFLKIRSKPDAMWEMRLLSQLIAKCFVERDMEFLINDVLQ